MIDKIKGCFKADRVLYTFHAKEEMRIEESGIIKLAEVNDAIMDGIVIEDYPKTEPYASCLIFGQTVNKRPLHVVCALDAEDNLAIIITVYEPSKDRWDGSARRKR